MAKRARRYNQRRARTGAKEEGYGHKKRGYWKSRIRRRKQKKTQTPLSELQTKELTSGFYKERESKRRKTRKVFQ